METKNKELWELIKNIIMDNETYGTKARQWSARKAQFAVKLYKEYGGEYTNKLNKNNSLKKWSEQDWRTKSGLKSSETGERYLPKKAIEALTDAEYKKTSMLKKIATKQYSKQPEEISKKVKRFRD